MGIINTTPDSFSDGGKFIDTDLAFKHGLDLICQGADILDIGGESTRPGAEPVSLQEELDRVLPVIEKLSQEAFTPISIDTYKPEVMSAAIAAGASMVNDVNGLQAEGAIDVVAQENVPVCIMHKQGVPKSMQEVPKYNHVIDDVIAFLEKQIRACVERSVALENIVVDPGIGFGKNLDHNLALLKSVEYLRERLACHVLIGVSRKSMIDMILKRDLDKRVSASVGLAVQAVINGAKIIRVHDVRQTYDAVRSVEAVLHFEE